MGTNRINLPGVCSQACCRGAYGVEEWMCTRMQMRAEFIPYWRYFSDQEKAKGLFGDIELISNEGSVRWVGGDTKGN